MALRLCSSCVLSTKEKLLLSQLNVIRHICSSSHLPLNYHHLTIRSGRGLQKSLRPASRVPSGSKGGNGSSIARLGSLCGRVPLESELTKPSSAGCGAIKQPSQSFSSSRRWQILDSRTQRSIHSQKIQSHKKTKIPMPAMEEGGKDMEILFADKPCLASHGVVVKDGEDVHMLPAENRSQASDVAVESTDVEALSAGSKRPSPPPEAQAAESKQNAVQSKKKKKNVEGVQLRFGIDVAAKDCDAMAAFELFNRSLAGAVPAFHQYHYNALLRIVSIVASSGDPFPGTSAVGKPSTSYVEGSGSRKTVASEGIDSSKPSGSSHVSIGPGETAPTGSSTAAAAINADDGDLCGAATSVTEEAGRVAEVAPRCPLTKEEVLRRGFDVYEHMKTSGVQMNEATFTAVARMAVAKGDGDLAFSLVKEMANSKIDPKLRSYSPAISTFASQGKLEKLAEVELHMLASGIEPGEEELRVMLQAFSDAGRPDKVYALLQRLRASVRRPSAATVSAVERWFSSSAATTASGLAEGGQNITTEVQEITTEVVKTASEAKGGGWHGLGWVGTGAWQIQHTSVDGEGTCEACAERLARIDLDLEQSAAFADSIARLATERGGSRTSFSDFQAWLEENGPYDAVVDAANVALFAQNFEDGGFNVSQLDTAMRKMQALSPRGIMPLCVLFTNRAEEEAEKSELGAEVLQSYWDQCCLYTTPGGSNDDWFWLYAAVKNNCLLVSNDEMRDHRFAILGDNFFPIWKERHQVRLTMSKGEFDLVMPPKYSICIQESISGTWHFPIAAEVADSSAPVKWLCATRHSAMQE